jgi:CO dehydrogenase/acetyl-CoA synthase beta subunit
VIEAAEKQDSCPEKPLPFKPGDMASLIRRMREFLADREERVQTCYAPFDGALLEREFGFTERKKGKADVILAEEVAVELGHPSTPSQAIVLSSYQPELVHHGRISIVGPDVDEIERTSRCPFGQVVMLAFRQGEAPDPFEIDTTQYLIRRLPGYMVRSVPGRLWARISRKARQAGLTMKTVGSALIAAYTSDFEAVERVEVSFVTSCGEDVEALAGIANEAGILAGKHKKLVLGADGEVECTKLDCESCDDKPVCDNLRDIVIKSRSRRQA